MVKRENDFFKRIEFMIKYLEITNENEEWREIQINSENAIEWNRINTFRKFGGMFLVFNDLSVSSECDKIEFMKRRKYICLYVMYVKLSTLFRNESDDSFFFFISINLCGCFTIRELDFR